MKKALVLCILAVMLSGCANNATTDETAAPAVSQTDALNTTASDLPPTTTSSDQTSSFSSAATVTMSDKTTDVTDTTTSKTSEKHTTTRKTVTSLSKTESTAKAETTDKTPETRADEKVSEKSVRSAATTKASKTTADTTTKPEPITQKVTQQTTVKTESRKAKKKTTTSEKIEYIEIEDVTCLASMVENLKDSSTPPSYYEKNGKGLKHDGTDYGKARAVYKWMRENGWGSCVYYSMETYFVCKGVGLECAYGFATDNGWYGHTYSVVKVDGIWYVMDTQGRIFLDNINYCTRMFDGNDKDIPRFKEDIWYNYDENGEYRDWSIE